MDPGTVIVSIVAMFVGLAIYKHNHPRRDFRRKSRSIQGSMTLDEQEDLRVRAENLMRRVQTLEEIIASDPKVRS